ncbi:unnamed protein product [Echinostoma caproni]|uniref:Bulb-type lectin domain-containing protein n=1 Tax=Echinostoma caproni TaxID=27848 RepID=A0A183B4T7_9TREM|nr:unnamed protein product [Echinostoma caproni]
MRVNIYTWTGTLLARFHAQLTYPVSVAVDSAYCIYITDNLAHCVVVFNYAGDVLGKIGSPGLTNYPFGVTILTRSSLDTGPNMSSCASHVNGSPNGSELVVVGEIFHSMFIYTYIHIYIYIDSARKLYLNANVQQ